MLTRAIVATVLIVCCGMFTAGASGPENAVPRRPLSSLPLTLESWRGVDAPPFADDIVSQLGVDEYVNRRYAAPGAAPVSVYVGYYASQRQGDTMHSPQNCLPGAGWQPVVASRASIAAPGGPVMVNSVIIQKGLERRAVYYWYQGRGRIVANEFANKGWLMFDAARLRRTDGGLVRLMTGIDRSPEAAASALAAFSAVLVPHLWSHIP